MVLLYETGFIAPFIYIHIMFIALNETNVGLIFPAQYYLIIKDLLIAFLNAIVAFIVSV